MITVDHYLPLLRQLEGGFVIDAADAGGATHRGVTLATWRRHYPDRPAVAHLQAMTDAEWRQIVLTDYWDAVRASDIGDARVALPVVDWAFHSGPTAVRNVQALLRVPVDGVVGPVTLAALNAAYPDRLAEALRQSRRRFLLRLVQQRPAQRKFLNGWLRRVDLVHRFAQQLAQPR